MINNILAIIIVWLYASIPFALLIGFTYKKDIRLEGSGNVGGSNLGRIVGAKAFILAFILDMSKGALAVLLANLVDFNPVIMAIIAIVSHSFSIFIKFKGGKGVATAFGFGLAYSFWGAIIAITFFLIILIISRYVSLSSMIAVFVYAIYCYLEQPTYYFILVIIMWIFIVFAHRENIVRIINHEERKVTWIDKLFKKRRRVNKLIVKRINF